MRDALGEGVVLEVDRDRRCAHAVVPSTDLERLQVGVEVERVVAALAADAGDADAAERRRQVADEERVDPHRARAHRPADPLGALLRARVDDRREAVARSSWRARRPRPRRAKVWKVSTGPNTSRWTISESLERGSISVGSYAEPAELGPAAAADDAVAVCPRALDEALDPGEVVGVDQRRDGGVVGARVAQHVGVGVAVEPLEERRPRSTPATSSRVPARHTWPASSYWPAAFAAAASMSASANTISGPLPPSSAVNGTRFAAAAATDQPAGLGRAGEADPAHAGVGDERRARLLADALDDVEDARREARPRRPGRRAASTRAATTRPASGSRCSRPRARARSSRSRA